MHMSSKAHEAMRILCLVLALSGGMVSCSGGVGAPATAAPRGGPFDGSRALERVGEQLAFGDRSPGSAGHASIQGWISDALEKDGWTVASQTFEYRDTTLKNIVGTVGSSGTPYLLIGAHYDNRPVADESDLEAPGPVPGANDGASGVSVLLGLADVLPTSDLKCRIDLAFFDGEDSGRINGWDWVVGSSYLAQKLSRAPDAVVVVDMVGDRDLQLYYERNSDPALSQAIWATGADLGYDGFIPEPKYSMIDDHTPFLNRGLAAVDIIDFDYPYWHTPQDTLDKLSAASLEAVGRTLQTWIQAQCQ
jgi:glutaminyl-peptide cyclotransferase